MSARKYPHVSPTGLKMQCDLGFGKTETEDVKYAVFINLADQDTCLFVHMKDGSMHSSTGDQAARDAEMVRAAGILVI
jgi:hypothetical protein